MLAHLSLDHESLVTACDQSPMWRIAPPCTSNVRAKGLCLSVHIPALLWTESAWDANDIGCTLPSSSHDSNKHLLHRVRHHMSIIQTSVSQTNGWECQIQQSLLSSWNAFLCLSCQFHVVFFCNISYSKATRLWPIWMKPATIIQNAQKYLELSRTHICWFECFLDSTELYLTRSQTLTVHVMAQIFYFWTFECSLIFIQSLAYTCFNLCNTLRSQSSCRMLICGVHDQKIVKVTGNTGNTWNNSIQCALAAR